MDKVVVLLFECVAFNKDEMFSDSTLDSGLSQFTVASKVFSTSVR